MRPLPVAAVAAPGSVPSVTVRIPAIDPRVAAAVSELAAIDRPATRARAAAAPRPPASRAALPTSAVVPPPSRAQAARADFYQGPTPTAVAPAAPSSHQQFPPPASRPPVSLQGAADKLRAQLGQFGTGNPRTAPAVASSPQAGRRSSVPASAFRPPPAVRRPARKSGNWGQSAAVVVFLFLLLSGVGSRIIEAVLALIQR